MYCIVSSFNTLSTNRNSYKIIIISNVKIDETYEKTAMSNCLLNIVAHLLRFYYAAAESVKDSRDVVFIVLAGQHKIVGLLSKGMTTLS